MTELERLQQNNLLACDYALQAIQAVENAKDTMKFTRKYYKRNDRLDEWKKLPSGYKVGKKELTQSDLYDMIKQIDLSMLKVFRKSLEENKKFLNETRTKLLTQDVMNMSQDDVMKLIDVKVDNEESKES